MGQRCPHTEFSGYGRGMLHPQMTPGCAGPSDRALQGGQRRPRARHRACKLHFGLLRHACLAVPSLHLHSEEPRSTKKLARYLAKSLYTWAHPYRFFCFFTLQPIAGNFLRTWLECTGAIRSAKERNSALFSPVKICWLHCHVLPFINIIQLLFSSQLRALGLLTPNMTNYVYKAQLQNSCVWVPHEKQAQNTISCKSVPQ